MPADAQCATNYQLFGLKCEQQSRYSSIGVSLRFCRNYFRLHSRGAL